MKKLAILFASAALALTATAQIPDGYYGRLVGKTGEAQILQALSDIISKHTVVSYSGLWDVYPTSDVKNNKIWDIYSTCDFTPKADQCGNYSNVCDCYNREHSVPKSWFNEATPMYSDAFHLYPTDGKVNNQRSNYPYGECSGGTSLGGKALGKLGTSTFAGYTNVGTVFEPVDEYKGDLARTYFYMVSCYYDRNFTYKEGAKTFTWSNGKAGLTPYAQAFLLKWARQDAVSTKETDRNEAIEKFQHNRNPFIDCQGLEEFIWGDKAGQTITVQDLADCGCAAGLTDEETGLQGPSFPTLTAVAQQGGATLYCLPEGAQVLVFTALGELKDRFTPSADELSVELPSGMWLFVITAQGNRQALKVLVK